GDGVTDKGMEQVRQVRTLEALRLNQTGAGAAGLAELKRLPRLKALELIGAFTDADLKPILGLTGVRVVSLRQTALRDDTLAGLTALKRLEVLTLDGHWDRFGMQFMRAGQFGVGGPGGVGGPVGPGAGGPGAPGGAGAAGPGAGGM